MVRTNTELNLHVRLECTCRFEKVNVKAVMKRCIPFMLTYANNFVEKNRSLLDLYCMVTTKLENCIQRP